MTDDVSLPSDLIVLARGQAGYVSTAQVSGCRISDRRFRQLVHAGRLVRVMRGVYDTGVLSRDLRERHPYDRERRRSVRRALVAYANGAAVGAGALALHGVRGLPRVITVEVAMRGGGYAQPRGDIRVRQIDLRGNTVRIEGAPVARLPVAFVQALDTLDRESWVACANDALRRGLTTGVELADALHAGRARRGVARRRHWFGLTNKLLESPLETRAWLALWDADIVPDELQRDIHAPDGRFLGRADMAWYLGRGRWLLVEIDGSEHHSSTSQLAADAVRQNGVLNQLRYRLLRYRAPQLFPPDGFVAEIEAVLREEAWTSGRQVPGPTSVITST
ncbi:type IV toxin-antitoxin system AbiEi family antitoxin domain-containing protein [Myceligenerans crystallogenes]|uniref:type IV toxin-antitoxin system AbiEi family antitoxin domain-containing protein n=1 Tax=Myceligenerans crystallogenes TaxID=316335 RepID=UPI0031D28361